MPNSLNNFGKGESLVFVRKKLSELRGNVVSVIGESPLFSSCGIKFYLPSMTSEQEHYQELAKSRAEDRINTLSEKRDSNKKDEGGSDSPDKKKFNKKDILSPKKIKDDIKSAALAFMAIDPEKDAVHFVVILFSLIADLITLIPFVGSFLAIPFSILIWILYAISGHLKKRIGRKAVITATAQACEFFGGAVFAIMSALPFYTVSAILNFWLVVAERKAQQLEEGK